MTLAVPLTTNQRIVYAVGAVVLCCHEIERHFKLIVPFINSDDADLKAILARHGELSKATLGEVAGKFVESASGDTEPLRAFVKEIIDRRNGLVHHFHDLYGNLLSAGRHEDVISDLKHQHQQALSLLRLLREMSLNLMEAMRDTTFRDTEQYDELAAACAKARESLAS